MQPVLMPFERSVAAVSLGTLVRICAALHSVPPARLPALKGRFSNFMSLGFPNVKAAGTGSRAEYRPEHVAQLLTAFELLRFRIPQPPAAKGVAEHMDAVLAAFGRAAKGAGKDVVLLAVTSNALLDDAKQAGRSDVAIRAIGQVAEAAGPGSSTAMVINVGDLVARAVAAASYTDEPIGWTFFASLGTSPKR